MPGIVRGLYLQIIGFQYSIRNFHLNVLSASSLDNTYTELKQRIKHFARTWYQKLYAVLFTAICAFGKMCQFALCTQLFKNTSNQVMVLQIKGIKKQLLQWPNLLTVSQDPGDNSIVEDGPTSVVWAIGQLASGTLTGPRERGRPQPLKKEPSFHHTYPKQHVQVSKCCKILPPFLPT